MIKPQFELNTFCVGWVCSWAVNIEYHQRVFFVLVSSVETSVGLAQTSCITSDYHSLVGLVLVGGISSGLFACG